RDRQSRRGERGTTRGRDTRDQVARHSREAPRVPHEADPGRHEQPRPAEESRRRELNAKRPGFAGAFLSMQSGIRESNPSHSLGKAGHSRYTNPATPAILALPFAWASLLLSSCGRPSPDVNARNFPAIHG